MSGKTSSLGAAPLRAVAADVAVLMPSAPPSLTASSAPRRLPGVAWVLTLAVVVLTLVLLTEMLGSYDDAVSNAVRRLTVEGGEEAELTVGV